MALQWLTALQRPAHDITVIPGNHDAYVPEVVARRAFETLFAAYQTGDATGGDGSRRLVTEKSITPSCVCAVLWLWCR